MSSRTIFVYLVKNDRPVPLGILCDRQDYFEFNYSRSWLSNPQAFAISPDMPLRKGNFISKTLHGVFRDHCPDRWGRKLMAVLANKPDYTLTDLETLIAIHSPYRIGALRFGSTTTGPSSIAPWAQEETVLHSAAEIHEFQKAINLIDDEDNDNEIPNLDAVRRAIAGSSSLGGGRPKALAYMNNKNWIVKFNRKNDIWEETAVEYASMRFAQYCGIHTANCQLLHDDKLDSVLLVERFDRDGASPKHMISAFTLMGLMEDGDWGSYQMIAEKCHAQGDANCGEEFFRRMIFSALIGNRDDHPRNHAFFYEGKSTLTPAYDLVPSSIPNDCLAINCGKMGRLVSRENLLSHVEPFGLNTEKAEQIVFEFESKFAAWPDFFTVCGVSEKDLSALEKKIMPALPSPKAGVASKSTLEQSS